MTRLPIGRSHSIYLGVSDELVMRFEKKARSASMSVIRLDLSDVSDDAGLANRLSSTFMFPYHTCGLDAAIDLISDLDWFGNPAGYLIIVDGLGHVDGVYESFGGMLPNVVDRWRSQGTSFIVVIRERPERLISALLEANRRMGEAGSLPWAQPGTGPVEVVMMTDTDQAPPL